MADHEQRQTLDYAAPAAQRIPRWLALTMATICLAAGVLFCAAIGLPALTVSSLEGRPEPAALVSVIVGGALCAVGMRLKRRR